MGDAGLSDLVGAAQVGSDQAFEDLAAYYSPRLYGFLVLRLGSRDDARDALQETLVAAWRGLPTVRDPRRFWPWLIRIADRKAVDIVRRRRETVELDADALVTAEQSMIELADALQRLPDHFRTVLLARYVLGLNEAETAAAIPSDQAGGHGSVKIRAIPVTPAQTVGRATVVTAGLSPCDVIVADPPRTLATGDAVQTYIAGDDNSPAINYQTLFGGRPAAPLPRIEGGIAHPAGMNSVAVNVVDERPTSGGAYYLYTAPDGFQQRVRYSRSQDFVVNLAHLRYGAPIGTIKVVSSGGHVLTTGHLDWYCSA